MNKKLVSIGIGFALLASPVLAAAQSTSTGNSAVISSLMSLITTLTQELQQLLAARSSSAAVQNTSGEHSYTNTQYGFSIQYPDGLKFSAAQAAQQSFVANIQNGTILATIGPVTGSFTAIEPGWGNNGVVTTPGSLVVSASSDSQDVANCEAAPSGPEIGATNVTHTNINGVDFLSYEIDQPATGLEDISHTYTTLRNGTCYSLSYTINAAASGHLNAADATANNAVIAQIQRSLNAIAQSFQFTNPVSGSPTAAYGPTIGPASGAAPLGVSFAIDRTASESSYTLNYGDGTSISASAFACGLQFCSMNHTYSNPGTYTATFTNTSGSVVRSFTITALASNASTGMGMSQCDAYSALQKGDTDVTTGGLVSQLQQFLGMPNVTGYYGAQTSIAYNNKCGNLGNAQPTYVAGMSKYTDPDFGFSFWYPSGWAVTQQSVASETDNGWYQGGSVVKELEVNDPNKPQSGVVVEEFASAGSSITELGHTMSPSPVGMDMKYYFDSAAGKWMFDDISGASSGLEAPGTITAADISNNTMGGLHVFPGARRFGADVIVPLSAAHFVVINNNDGQYTDQRMFADTIVATNAAVAIPVPTAQQIATIRAEAKEYAGY